MSNRQFNFSDRNQHYFIHFIHSSNTSFRSNTFWIWNNCVVSQYLNSIDLMLKNELYWYCNNFSLSLLKNYNFFFLNFFYYSNSNSFLTEIAFKVSFYNIHTWSSIVSWNSFVSVFTSVFFFWLLKNLFNPCWNYYIYELCFITKIFYFYVITNTKHFRHFVSNVLCMLLIICAICNII